MTCKVILKITGPSLRVTSYVIDEEILERLMNATIDDALYEDNPISLVGNISLRSRVVAEGFCIHKTKDIEFELLIDNVVCNIEAVGFLPEGEDYAEFFDTPSSTTLIAREENIELLGEGFDLADNEMLVVEVEDIKYAQMTFVIESPVKISVQDIELGLVDLDVDSDLSRATYDLGLLNGMESDIRYAVVKNEKYLFDMEVLNSYSSDFYLVKKIDGVWTKEWLSCDDDDDDDE
jgi:hypothetical protein